MKHNLKYTVALVYYSLVILLLNCNQHNDQSNARLKGHKTFADRSVNEKDLQGYRVVEVKDGDTFTLLMDGEEQVVRLAHIDCPEKNQPFGSKAKQAASDLCFGKFVTLIHDSKYDRNKRLIAEVILPNGRNVNKELVKKGLAWHYIKYSDDSEYAELETEARDKKVGLWSEPGAVEPWNWRRH